MRKNERRFQKKVGDTLLYTFSVTEHDRGVYDTAWWPVGPGAHRFPLPGARDGQVPDRYGRDRLFAGRMMVEAFERKLVHATSRGRSGNNMPPVTTVPSKIVEKSMFKFKPA